MKSAAMFLLVAAPVVCAACAGSHAKESTRTSPAGPQLAGLGYYGEDAPPTTRPEDCPGAADGRELVGKQLGEWQLAGWANTGGAQPSLAGLRGRVVVVRFWTGGCEFCEESMPALETLSHELRDQPVTFVGAFHAKPESSARDLERPMRATRSWRITFPLAIDREWRTLRTWWLDTGHRHATSVTFVIDKRGRVAHVHPGPVYSSSADPAHAAAHRDYLTLRAAILTAARQ